MLAIKPEGLTEAVQAGNGYLQKKMSINLEATIWKLEEEAILNKVQVAHLCCQKWRYLQRHCTTATGAETSRAFHSQTQQKLRTCRIRIRKEQKTIISRESCCRLTQATEVSLLYSVHITNSHTHMINAFAALEIQKANPLQNERWLEQSSMPAAPTKKKLANGAGATRKITNWGQLMEGAV